MHIFAQINIISTYCYEFVGMHPQESFLFIIGGFGKPKTISAALSVETVVMYSATDQLIPRMRTGWIR